LSSSSRNFNFLKFASALISPISVPPRYNVLKLTKFEKTPMSVIPVSRRLSSLRFTIVSKALIPVIFVPLRFNFSKFTRLARGLMSIISSYPTITKTVKFTSLERKLISEIGSPVKCIVIISSS